LSAIPPIPEVHLWPLCLESVPPQAVLWLSELEQERYHRFVNPLVQQRFLAAHAQLRWILSRYLGRDPAEIVFAYTAWGKPWLPHCPDLHFNLSHSLNRGLLALRWGSPVGVDIEWHRPCPVRRLAQRWFTPAEVAWLARRDPQEQVAAFFRLWTLREAWGKYGGRGIGAWRDLQIDPEIPSLVNQPQQGILLPMAGPYSAALVVDPPAVLVTCHPQEELRIESRDNRDSYSLNPTFFG